MCCLLLAGAAPLAIAAGPSGAQQKGAEAFLAAVATGSPEAVAQELHPDELDKLRSRLLTLLRAEGSQGGNTYRSRLFGPGRSLAAARERDRAEVLRRAVGAPADARARIREVRLAGGRARTARSCTWSARACSPRIAARSRSWSWWASCSTASSGAPSSPPKSKRNSTTSSKDAASPVQAPTVRQRRLRRCRLPRRSRWRPASANCWRAPRRRWRRATARSTTTSS